MGYSPRNYFILVKSGALCTLGMGSNSKSIIGERNGMSRNNGLSRIYIKDVLALINKKDIRSVNTWCEKNNVEIFQDSSGKFVIEAEFYNAYNQPIIKRYKKKYGENWVKMYELCKENKLYLADEQDKPIYYSGRYQPKSKAAKDFLKNFE